MSRYQIRLILCALTLTFFLQNCGFSQNAQKAHHSVRQQTIPKSGLKVGSEVKAFNPLHYSGPDKGTNHCPVCTHLDKPVVFVFGKQTLNTIGLARQLESLTNEYSSVGLKCFVILTDGSKTSASDLVRHYQFRNVGICLLDPESQAEVIKDYHIDNRFENTVLFYRNYVVEENTINLQTLEMNRLVATIARSVAHGKNQSAAMGR